MKRKAAERAAEIEREQALLREHIALNEKLIDQSRRLIEGRGRARPAGDEDTGADADDPASPEE